MGFFHASQFLVKTLEGEDEFLMIHAEEVEHGGMKIPDVYGVFDYVIAEVIGFAVVHSTLDSSACEPTRETTRVMIPTKVRTPSLGVGCPAEFTAPDNERFV